MIQKILWLFVGDATAVYMENNLEEYRDQTGGKDERKNFSFDDDHSSDTNTFTFGSYTPNKNDFEASRSSRMP